MNKDKKIKTEQKKDEPEKVKVIKKSSYSKKKKAKKLLTDILNISDENKIPYMGWQYEENIFWPDEKPSWTSAALILCADSILKLSDASDLFVENQLSFY